MTPWIVRSRRDAGPRRPVDRLAQARQISDDCLLAAAGYKLHRGLDLWPHRTGGELALREMLAGLRDGHAVEEPLARLLEVHRHSVDVGREREAVRRQIAGEHRGRQGF